MPLNALKRDKIKDSRYVILSVSVGHVEILENDKKARLPWSLKNGGEWRARHPSRLEIVGVLAWELTRKQRRFYAKDVNQARSVGAGPLVRVRENFCREREAACFKITFLSRSFSFCEGHTDLEESENEKRRKNKELQGYILSNILSCITVDHGHRPFSPHSPTRSLKKDSEVAGGGLGFHCENFGVLAM